MMDRPSPRGLAEIGLAISTIVAFAPLTGVCAPESRVLKRGTPVYLTLDESISSERTREGTPVRFRVTFDVRAHGELLIQEGAFATGRVGKVEHTGIAGKEGYLVIYPEQCTAVDGSTVLLEGEHRVRGKEYEEESVGIAGVVCCLGIFLRGGKAEVREETIVFAFVATDTMIGAGPEAGNGNM